MRITTHPPVLLTERGGRSSNQDSVYPSAEHKWTANSPPIFLVCDGVGGAARGEVASKMACEIIGNSLAQLDRYEDEDILHAIQLTEEAIADFTKKNPNSRGMATTITLVAMDQGGVIFLHLGDSRIYQFRDGKIIHETRDHSLVQELLDNQIITAEQAKEHPKRNVVTRALIAAPNNSKADLHRTADVKIGDIFFLCSDGILESCSDEFLTALFADHNLDDQKIMAEIKVQCAQHSRDNFSACLVRIGSINHEDDELVPTRRRDLIWAMMQEWKKKVVNAFSSDDDLKEEGGLGTRSK